jgi:Beta/Gamma crystallin
MEADMRRQVMFALLLSVLLTTEAHAERIRLYQAENYHGNGRLFAAEEQNLRAEGDPSQVASAKVITGRWLLCERAFFGGSCLWISHDIPSFHALAFGSEVESLRPERVPVLRRQWGDRRPASRSSLALFSGANYEGDWVALKESAPNLGEAGVAFSPSSVVLQSGAWRLCTQPDFAGACLSMTASAWDLREIFSTQIRSAERLP